jgi:glycosyltransferase involved in cell wall biosynthesis
LVPSLWNEAWPLVPAEGMINGIPVLGSNRGGLPEPVGDAGFLFDIPPRYTPESRDLPSAREVEPWVETIVRLWDDPELYARYSQAARTRAQEWRPERLAPLWRDFFANVFPQPGPPLAPRAYMPAGAPRARPGGAQEH